MAKGKNLRRLAELLNCRPGWMLGEEENEDAGMGAGQTPLGKDVWQQRARAAEKKLAALRTGLRVLLETSADLPRSQVKPAEGSPAATSAPTVLKCDGGSANSRAQE